MINYATYTDVGRRKKGNQDSHSLLAASTRYGDVVMALVCDGVGGLSGGEVASSSVIQRFSTWFAEELPSHMAQLDSFAGDGECAFLKGCWGPMLDALNAAIYRRGQEREQAMGTTFTGMLLVGDAYQIAQVGDSRAYRLNAAACEQLTEDQTLVNREVRKGNLTPEQARNHPQSNVILQAVGAQGVLEPEYFCGTAAPGDLFLLCSDGFCHKVEEEELAQRIGALAGASDFQLHDALAGVVRTNLDRGERDNITAVCFTTSACTQVDVRADGWSDDETVQRRAS